MKHEDIKPCAICGQGVMSKGIPLFYTIKIQRHAIDLGAVQRQNGLEQMMGGHAQLANIMGPNEDMTKQMTEEKEVWVCDDCSNNKLMSLLLAIEEEG